MSEYVVSVEQLGRGQWIAKDAQGQTLGVGSSKIQALRRAWQRLVSDLEIEEAAKKGDEAAAAAEAPK